MERLVYRVVFLLYSTVTYCQEFPFESWTSLHYSHRKLTPYIKSGNASLARELSAVHPDNFLGIKSHSGFLTVKEMYGSEMFFWFFPVDTDLGTTPWIIWLQGGPGFSSLFGLFEIIGPLKIENGELKLRSISWAEDYSLLFIDNPVGAGFSFAEHEDGYPDNEDDVGEQLLELLKQFLQMFPELRLAPLFVAGESYAGKYVPALGIQIHRNHDEVLNLRGLIIGSGLIDPGSMLEYSELCSSLGILDGAQAASLKGIEEEARIALTEGRMIDAANKFNQTIEYIKMHSQVSVYDFNKDPSIAAPGLEEFVNRPDVRKAIGVGNLSFNFNNQVVYNKMLPDIMNTAKPFLEELLEYYGIMCWHGQLDIITAYGLAVNAYRSLNWSRSIEYHSASREYVRLNRKIVGYKKKGGNFIEVLIRKAGHILPADRPDVAMFLLRHFIKEYK